MICDKCGTDSVSDASEYDGQYPCTNPHCESDERERVVGPFEDRIRKLERRVADLEGQRNDHALPTRKCNLDGK